MHVNTPSTLPVTLLSGFLDAVKTTVLSLILSNRQGKKVTVSINDVSAINIDSVVIKNKVSLKGKSFWINHSAPFPEWRDESVA